MLMIGLVLVSPLSRLSFPAEQLEGNRKLPENFSPGKTVTVNLFISPGKSETACTLTEVVPEGWRIVAAAPGYEKEKELLIENVYTWSIPALRKKPYTITYVLEVPWAVRRPKQFSGYLKIGNKNLPLSGDTKLPITE